MKIPKDEICELYVQTKLVSEHKLFDKMNVSDTEVDMSTLNISILNKPTKRTEHEIVGNNDRRAAHAHHRRQARRVEHNVEDRLEQRRVEVGEVLAKTLNVDRHTEWRGTRETGWYKNGSGSRHA